MPQRQLYMKPKPKPKPRPKPRPKHPAGEKNWALRSILVVLLIFAAGGFGWWWKDQVLVRQVNFKGLQHTDEAVLLKMIHVDSTFLFFNLDPVMIADRVRRHPWVENADVQRFPNATLSVEVLEREPVMLLMDQDGYPDRYLDADGFQMPFLKQAVYDVPLITGLAEPMHTMHPVKHRALLKLLGELERIPPQVDALISAFEIEKTGEISLYTTPKPNRGSIHVILGRDQFVEKLSKLHAFWHEAVLQKEDVEFASIDLRFDSQIITKEVRLSQ